MVTTDDGGALGDLAPERSTWWADVAWDLLERDWRRRETTSLRRAVFRVVPEAEQQWKRLSFAVFSGTEPDQLDPRPLSEEQLDELAHTAIRSVLQLPDLSPLDRAGAATLAYYECLCAWERTDYYERLSTIIAALRDEVGQAPIGIDVEQDALPSPQAAVDDPEVAATAVLHAAVLLASTLEAEFEVENALFCSCTVDIARQAEGVLALGDELPETSPVRDLPQLVELLDSIAARAELGPVHRLAGLLAADALAVTTYFGALAREVGPATTTFVESLGNPTQVEADLDSSSAGAPSAATVARIEQAIAEVGRAAEALGDDVLASEARSHLMTLEAMRRLLASEKPSLILEEGSIIYLFPFGMPEVDPEALVRDLLRSARATEVGALSATARASASAQLGGLDVIVDPGDETDAWMTRPDDLDSSTALISARIQLRGHHLALQSTVPLRHAGIELSVRLSSLGNHVVRMEVPLDVATSIALDAQGDVLGFGEEPETWTPFSYGEDLRARWTPHDLEQWVRRANAEGGAEAIWFVDREVAAGGEPPPDPDGELSALPLLARRFDRLVDVAVAVAEHLPAYVHEMLDDLPEADHGTEPFESPTRLNDLANHAQVVVNARRVGALHRDGTVVPVADPDEIVPLVGSQVLFLHQRPFASSIDEWVRHETPTPKNLLDGLTPPGDLIHRSDDVTVVCSLGAPNWVAVEYLEMVELTASLAGLFASWRTWLTREERMLTRHHQDHDLRGQVRAIAANRHRVTQTLEHVHSSQLTRTAIQRRLVGKLIQVSEVTHIERSLREKLDSVGARSATIEREIEAREAERAEQRDVRIAVVAVVLSAVGVAGVFQWVNSDIFFSEGWGPLRALVITVEVLLALIVGFIVGNMFRSHTNRSRRRRRSRRS